MFHFFFSPGFFSVLYGWQGPPAVMFTNIPVCYNENMPDEKSRLVYSTNTTVPRRENPVGKSPKAPMPTSQQKVYVRLDRKGRGGKSVTLIEGLQMSDKNREAFLKQLKAQLGTGGTLKNDVFEIQGDHRDAIIELLQVAGYKPKRAGG
jgi:translation initiation factor 1